MVKSLLIPSVAAVLLGAVHSLDANKTINELSEGHIVPTVFEKFTPTAELKIVYGEDLEVENGITLAADSLVKAPQVLFKGSNASKYTFLVANIDAKSPQEHIQWLKTNINADQNDGQDITPYQRPMQPLGDEPQRLVYALFEQPSKNITSTAFNSSKIEDDLKQFVKDNDLKLVNAAYVFTQNQTTIIANRLQRLADSFRGVGIIDGLLGTVDNLLDEVEGILGINIELGPKKNKKKGKKNNNAKNRENTDFEDEDDEDDDSGSLINIHLGLNTQPRPAIVHHPRNARS